MIAQGFSPGKQQRWFNLPCKGNRPQVWHALACRSFRAPASIRTAPGLKPGLTSNRFVALMPPLQLSPLTVADFLTKSSYAGIDGSGRP